VPVRFGHYEFDPVRRYLTRQGRPIHLTPLAFSLLELLIAEAPRVFPKQELHARLWPDSFVSDASLTSLIKELRRALDDRDERSLIRTVNRVGYAFGGSTAATASTPSAPPGAVIHWVEINGRRLRLNAGENLIGRAPDAEIWLDVASISRRHATIIVADATAELHDLGSKNGTLANDSPVTAPVAIADGDRIGVGKVTLVYRRAVAGLPTETQSPANAGG
jgi:DNA-binding winged helix-turn-helix (wHTH) protein